MLQVGGSDQWGNIVNGVELIKRYSNNHVYGLTTPLITLASGAKMGKTESGAVWLDKKFLSPYDYWQFWRNIDDRDVLKFLKIFTDISLEEIEKNKDKDINELKILLANKTTSMLHGEDEAKNSQDTAKQTFTDNALGDNLPSITIEEKMLINQINIIDLIIMSKMETSKSEIRRLIKGNGIKINGHTISDEKLLITKSLFKDNPIKLSLGKKKHIKVELT
jgi:tyrosyl-tRNA synthetase